MIGLIARREILETVRDGRFRWSVVALGFLTAISFYTGWHEYRLRKVQYETIQQSERQRWLDQRERSPHTAVHQGVYVFRPQLLLSSVDPGIEQYVGMATHAEEGQNLFKWKPAEDTRALHRFGEITAAATLQIVIPLVIALLVYPVFIAEREQGTLRLTMALGVRTSDFICGKLLGVLAPLAAVVVPATAIGAVALCLSSDASYWPGSVERLLWMIAAYIAYFGVVAAVSIAVSARSSSSRLALVTLLALWFGTTVLAPQIATETAELLIPTPSGADVITAIARDNLQQKVRDDNLRDIENRLLKQYGVHELRELPVSPVGIVMQSGEESSARISNYHFGRLYGAWERQTDFLQHAGVLSPLLSLQVLSMGLAGTDPAQHADIAHAAERYREELVRIMNDDITRFRDPTLPITTLADDFHRGRDVWERVPPFRYHLPPLTGLLERYRASLYILGLWLAGSAIAAALAVRRVRVD
jgi:ABC-2 type transport system permease protein